MNDACRRAENAERLLLQQERSILKICVIVTIRCPYCTFMAHRIKLYSFAEMTEKLACLLAQENTM